MKLPHLIGFFLTAVMSVTFAQTQLAPLPPDGFVTLKQIVNDFAINPDSATQKYAGLRITVYGRVSKVHQSGDGQGDPLAVHMQLRSQSTPEVKAIFAADNLPTTDFGVASNHTHATVYHRNWQGTITRERSYIEAGQFLGVRGTFQKFVAGQIVLKDCTKLCPRDLLKKLREHGISGD